MSKIPQAKHSRQSVIPQAQMKVSSGTDKIVFSFESLERTEYFNLDGTCPNWPSDLFKMMKEVSTYKSVELKTGRIRTYRVHSHENVKKCPSPLPDGVELKDFYQIRISTSKGGIHGVFRENVFFVIWFDPLHNMYPDDRFGGLRKVQMPGTCCKDRDEEIARLEKELKQSQKDMEEWKKLAEDTNN